MAQLGFDDFQSLMSDEIGDSDNDTNNGHYINMAARDIWRHGAWPNRRGRDFVVTTASYSTGTVATDGTTGIVGTGTSWATSPHAGMKFALGYGKPWYDIASVGSTTAITLADAYSEADVSASTYIIYDDRVALPSDCDVVQTIWLHDGSRAYKMPIVTELEVEHYGHYPRSADRPWYACFVENTSGGVKRVRMGPYSPDTTYRLEIRYLKTYTDMTGSNTSGLPQELDDAILMLALSHAYRRDHFQRSSQMKAEGLAQVRREWQRISDASPQITHLTSRREHVYRDIPVNLDDLEI